MKNKCVCVLLTLSLISAMSLPIFADTTLNTSNTSGTVTTYVDYGETYTITIPTDFNLAGSSTILKVTVNELLLTQGHTLKVTMTSDNYDTANSTWRLKLGNSYVKYQLTNSFTETNYKSGDPVLKLNSGTIYSEAKIQTSYTASDAIYAGRYSDTLTFTVTIEDTAN